MKTLLIVALTGVLLLPALPGAAQLPSPSPSPSATPSATPTALPTATADPAAQTGAPAGPTLTYAGRGLTRSVALSLAGNVLGLGLTSARTANAATEECAGVACATAAAAVEPFGETASATAPGDPGPKEVQAFDLGGDADPQLEQLLAASLGSAVAQAAEQPSASGTAQGGVVDVTLTQTIVDNLPPEVTDGLSEGLGQIGEALGPIAEGDPTGVVGGLTDTLAGLVDDLSSSPLVRLQVGESTSASEFADGAVTARAQAAGSIITLLPTPTSTPLAPEGLAVIEVTPSQASVSANGTDRAVTEVTGSVARITLFPGILDALPGLNPSEVGETPLGDILELLPPEVIGLLPGPVGDILGTSGEPSEAPSAEPTAAPSEEGPTGTPIDDLLQGFMQADEGSGGFVIDLETGTEQTCVLEGTPVETCVTVGGTSENFTDDGLGVGVLAAGVDVQAVRADGAGQLELSLGRSEAGVAAAFVQPAPAPAPTPQTGLPRTGTASSVVVPALALMVLGGGAFVALRRGREV